MANILVAFYSRSGNTATVARAIAEDLGADIEEIGESRSRSGVGGYLWSCWEALGRRPAQLLPSLHNPADYDLVVLGSPVWASHVSSPMRAYIGRHAGLLGRTALFMTEGGSGGSNAIADMAKLLRQPPIATLILKDRELAADPHGRLDDFISRIRMLAVAAPGGAPDNTMDRPSRT